MTNLIEIRVQATNDTRTGLDEAKAEVAAAAAEMQASLEGIHTGGVGGGVGTDLSSGMSAAGAEAESFWADAFARDLNADAEGLGAGFAADFGEGADEGFKKFQQDMIGSLSELSKGQYAKLELGDNVVKPFSSGNQRAAAEELRKQFEDGLLEEGPPDVMLPNGKWASEMESGAGRVGTAVAEQMNLMIHQGMHDEAMTLGDDFTKMLVPPAAKGGKDAGAAAASGMSPLIVAAIGGAATIGAPLLLAGLGAAFVGIAGLALKSNVVIAQDYKTLAADAENTVKQAAAPIAGDLNQALMGLDNTVVGLQPQLDGLFANIGPDTQIVAGGIGALVSGALPGLSSAIGSSQVIAQDFANSMGPLGSGIGSFFTGLTRDASTTGAGLQSVFGVLSNTVSTLGTVLGSASSGISADLMGIDPVINGLLSGIRAISNPATVSGLIGVFGAMKLGGETGPITNGLTSMSTGLKGFAKDAETTSGMMGTIKGAAGGLGGALGTAAGVMSGPWGLAVGAGIGLLSGFAGMMFESMHASDALTVSQQGLADAIAKDNGVAGANTAAYIAQQDAANGLVTAASAAGVSIATYTQAVIGNKQAQQDVTSAVDKTNQAQMNQATTAEGAANSTGKFSDEQKGAETAALGSMAATNKLTDANKQLLSSMQAQAAQVAATITKQAQMTAATNALNDSQNIFDATLASGYQTMVGQQQATTMTTLAALNLGQTNYGLNQSLYTSVDAYSQAQTEGNAYLQVLTSMSGTQDTLLGTEAGFTTSLDNFTKAIKTNGTSLDVNNALGAKNITNLTNMATAADKAAGAVYDNEVSTKGAAKAYDDANTKLAQEKQAFIDAADKAGLNKDQVQQLANQLFQLPKNVSITTNLNTGPADTGLGELLNRINTSHGTITVYENSVGQVGTTTTRTKAQAVGGPATHFAAVGGLPYGSTIMNEQGPEAVNLPNGSLVVPAANTAAMFANGFGYTGGHGGEQRIILDVQGADQELVTLLRKIIRARAGSGPNSVQMALGQSF